MGLEESNTIDLIMKPDNDGRVALCVVDAGITVDPEQRIALLRKKINGYAEAIAFGELRKTYPDHNPDAYYIRVVCARPPTPEMQSIRDVYSSDGKIGIPVAFEEFPEGAWSAPDTPPADPSPERPSLGTVVRTGILLACVYFIQARKMGILLASLLVLLGTTTSMLSAWCLVAPPKLTPARQYLRPGPTGQDVVDLHKVRIAFAIGTIMLASGLIMGIVPGKASEPPSPDSSENSSIAETGEGELPPSVPIEEPDLARIWEELLACARNQQAESSFLNTGITMAADSDETNYLIATDGETIHPNSEEGLKMLIGAIRKVADEGSIRAAAVVMDATYQANTKAPPQDALRARIEQRGGAAYEVILPYRKDANGTFNYGELRAVPVEGRRWFFSITSS